MNTDGEQYRENTDGSMNGAQSFGDFGRGGTAYTDHAGNTPYVGGPSSGTYAAPDEYERSNPITANHGSYGGGYGSAYTQWKNPNAPYEYQPPTQTGSFDRQAQTSSADAVFSSRGRALTAVRQGGFRKKVFLKKGVKNDGRSFASGNPYEAPENYDIRNGVDETKAHDGNDYSASAHGRVVLMRGWTVFTVVSIIVFAAFGAKPLFHLFIIGQYAAAAGALLNKTEDTKRIYIKKGLIFAGIALMVISFFPPIRDMIRSEPGKAWAFVFLLVFILIFPGVFIGVYVANNRRRDRCTLFGTGIVGDTRYHPGDENSSGHYTLVYYYTVNDRDYHRESHCTFSANPKNRIGSEIKLLINPDNPTETYEPDFEDTHSSRSSVIAVGLVILLSLLMEFVVYVTLYH